MNRIGKDGKSIMRGHIELWYPRLDDPKRSIGQPQEIEIGLSDVRAAQDLVVDYDFVRDGWRLRMATIFEWEIDDKVWDEGLVEVGFVPSGAAELVKKYQEKFFPNPYAKFFEGHEGWGPAAEPPLPKVKGFVEVGFSALEGTVVGDALCTCDHPLHHHGQFGDAQCARCDCSEFEGLSIGKEKK